MRTRLPVVVVVLLVLLGSAHASITDGSNENITSPQYHAAAALQPPIMPEEEAEEIPAVAAVIDTIVPESEVEAEKEANDAHLLQQEQEFLISHQLRQQLVYPTKPGSTRTSAFGFALVLVITVLVLPLALAYRLLPQFRNALLALTSYHHHHKQQPSTTSIGGPGGGGGDQYKEDVYHPQLLPTTFRSMLRAEDVQCLLANLPTNVTYKDWQLLYASELHGFNLHAAYRKCRDMGPCLLVVMDFHRHVAAAYISETLQPDHGRRFFGNGECFLASVFPKFQAYHYSGSSRAAQEFVMATDSFLAFGGGGKAFALWMDAAFDKATSEANEVFGNTKSLLSRDSFKCAAVEIWSFALPKPSLRSKAMSAVLGRIKV